MFNLNLACRAGNWLALALFLAAPNLWAQTNGTPTNITVRIMAANLNGNTQSYQPFALRIFQGLVPDIVAIQEFNYGGNTPADFRSMIDTAFGTNFVYYRENYPSGIPNGIISRYPIVASGSWADPVQSQPNRGFAWAQIALPGTNTIYVVSVHLLTSSATDRSAEAANLKGYMQTNFPPGACMVLAGDFNCDTRTEAAMVTFGSFLSDNPIPTDAEVGGDSDTSINRNHPHDYLLPSFSFTNFMVSCAFASHSFSNGLVFDSRVYTPLSDVPPILFGDSSNAQHMAVMKDFRISFTTSNLSPAAPSISTQPQSQTVNQGGDASFTVAAAGAAPLNYQWRFGGVDISGATSTIYARTNVQSGDAGGYTVVVTNTIGSVTSLVAVLTLATNQPSSITNQPQSQSVFVGQTANFTVGASGATPLTYQWRMNGTNIPGASSSSYSRANVAASDAGSYSVAVSNQLGGVISSNAVLTVLLQQGTTLALWDFNSVTPDTNVATGVTTPSIGSGTAAVVGGISPAFATGSATDPASSGSDNSGWITTSYPAQGTGNKTAGVQFSVSTVGRQNIVIRWDQRDSSTGSKYTRLQYRTNATTFIDFPTPNTVSSIAFESQTNSLAGIPGVNNNSNFAFRIVAEFESSAIGTVNSNYVGATGTYGPGGTVRFDMVTVSGAPLSSSNPPAARATLGSPAYLLGTGIQFTVTGTAGSNYIVQASTNLASSNWVSLVTNASPFTFVDSTTSVQGRRFYRAMTQ
jgi:endonuclease/exonuclease/phosphatase family metal-dependent hydrolase